MQSIQKLATIVLALKINRSMPLRTELENGDRSKSSPLKRKPVTHLGEFRGFWQGLRARPTIYSQ